MEYGYVVSDLHILSRRSTASRNAALLDQAIASAKLFVFNGDTFDFRWSTLPTLDLSLKAASETVRRWVEQNPGCAFHFVLGNHDSLPQFVDVLAGLADEFPNLKVHEQYFLLQDRLFTHGDAAHSRGCPARLARYRAKFAEGHSRGRIANTAYSSAIRLGLHRAIPYALPRELLAARIVKYLSAVSPTALESASHIYIGHTHLAFSDFKFRQWVFHNTGAMIQGVKYQILQLQLLEERPLSSELLLE